MEIPTLAIARHEGHHAAMTSSPIPAARGRHLFDLLAQVPDPRKMSGRRYPLARLLARQDRGGDLGAARPSTY
jgi:hypothetical protein